MTTITPQPQLVSRGEHRRRALRLVTLAWVFGAAWMYIPTGSVMQEFLRTLGTPQWAYGFIGALPMVCGLMQLPGSVLIERYAIRKRLFIWAATLSRCLYVLAGLVPWVLPGLEEVWWRIVAILIAVSWAMAHATGPAWFSWMANVIPRRVRGRYMAFRSQVGQVIGMVVVISVGFLLDHLGGSIGADDARLRTVTSLLLIVAGVLGVLDIQCFHPIRDDEDASPEARERRGPLMPRVRTALRSATLWRFLAFVFVLHLAIGFLGAYLFLFLREELGQSMVMTNIAIGVVPLMVTVVALRFWGSVIDKVGSVKVLSVSSLMIVLGPLGWLFCTPELFWPGALMTLISPFAFAGVMLAMQNLTMRMTSAKDSAAEGCSAGAGGSINAALISIAGAIGALLSGFLGGALADAFAGFRYEADWHGMTITYHGLLFIVSMGIRAIAAVIAISMVARHAPRLRDAVKQQVAEARAKRAINRR